MRRGILPPADLNRLNQEIAELCRQDVLADKWLLAPSRRVGFQWLDSVALSGRPLVNIRIKTVRGMALELAAAEMERLGLRFLRGIEAEVLVSGIVERLREVEGGYLLELDAGPGLTRAVLRAITDLRLAGVSADRLDVGEFEVELKGRQVKSLLGLYEGEMRERRLLDYAGVLKVATGRLERERSAAPGGTRLMMPEDMEQGLKGLERSFWEAVGGQDRVVLPVDRPGASALSADSSPQPRTETEVAAQEQYRGRTEEGDTAKTGAALLGWVLDPAGAPAPAGDGTASIYRAIGEVNEVREVLRRCAEGGIGLDQVELLHTDTETYVPLIFELACRLRPDGAGEIPVTFAEGIPVSYSRPARALLIWLHWAGEGFPQSVLQRALEDGLLEVGGAPGEAPGFSSLGTMLGALPISLGRERYLEAIDREVATLGKRVRRKERPAGLERRIAGLEELRALIVDLLEWAPEDAGQVETLKGAAAFLKRRARCVDRFDEYCNVFLQERIAELTECLEDAEAPGLQPRQWLLELAGGSRVGGQGPRPGCLYVTPVPVGGNSGRAHTFIVGLDDHRFPGTGGQDPILLDGERDRISDELPTGAERLAGSVSEFAALLARLRGNVTLSYSCRDLTDDREIFPSSILMSAFRVLSGNHEGDQRDLLEWLPEPVSFAPGRPERCIDMTEWWLWRLIAAGALDPLGAVASDFENLERGLKARRARESDAFTEYDGFVPLAGEENDPTRADGPVMSARRLETLGRCPMEYFFRYILAIEPPAEHQADPTAWLEANERGVLLHAVFREFMSHLSGGGRLPEFDRDVGMLEEILEERITLLKEENPPPGTDVFERERQELRQAARIFLTEEEEFCLTSRPAYFEAAIGVPEEGTGTALDTPDPVEVALPGGQTVRARGRIDRVDEVPGSGGTRFSVWDYKTGSSYRYDRVDPFKQGRCLQNALYLALAESRLREVHPGAEAVAFGFFFPGTREHGERIRWTRSELDEFGGILERLCRLASGGCFPFSDDAGDVRFSDYVEAFGDPEAAAEAAGKKMRNRSSQALEPIRELRGIECDDETG